MITSTDNQVWWITIEASRYVKGCMNYAPVYHPPILLTAAQRHYTELFTHPDIRNHKRIGHWKADWVYVT